MILRACVWFDALPADVVNVAGAALLVAMLILARSTTREPAR